MHFKDLAIYTALAFIWGLSFLVLLKVVHAFGWIGAVSLRALLAGCILLMMAFILKRSLNFNVPWWHFAVVGATTVAIQLMGLSYSTPRIGTAMAAILVATIPLFSMLISHFWGLERINKIGLIGLVLGFIGLVLLVGFPVEPSTGSFIMACLVALMSFFATAFGSNYVSRYLNNTGSWEVTIGAFLSGGIMTLPFLLVVPIPTQPAAVDYGYLLILGGTMSALAYVMYFYLVGSIGTTKAISVEFAVTIVAVLVGALVLHETISWVQLVGAGVIMIGCSLVLGLYPKAKKASLN